MMETKRATLRDFSTPVPLASLAIFRVLFGAIVFIFTLRFIARGWVTEFYATPRTWFPFIDSPWFHPLPPNGMLVVFAIQAISALSLCVGLCTRTSALVFFASFTWSELLDKTNYLNHYYLVSLIAILLAFIPAGRLFSLDARWWPDFRRSHGPAWILWFMRIQIGLVYFFAGIGKLNADWLIRAQPLRIWLAATGDIPLLGPMLTHQWTPWVMSWSGAVFDILVPFALLHRRLRWWAFAGLVTFHLITRALFPLGMFPWVMLAGVSLFFCPDWPSRFIATGRESSCNISRKWRFVAAIFAFVQMAIPLRRFALPGNWLWHEQGFRFSWNVMLIEKSGDARFTLVDSAGIEKNVTNREWLTPRQEQMMSTQPDMILDFAKQLAKRFPGHEVRGDVWVSWNGRAASQLIDPHADLAKATDPLAVCLPAPK
jgi:vitamin K-dependent gamma-carboxylase